MYMRVICGLKLYSIWHIVINQSHHIIIVAYQKLPNFLKWEVFMEKYTFYNDKIGYPCVNN